jgi:hypothetical protein
MTTMNIQGLVATQVIKVNAVKAVDLVVSYQTYSVGGGQWSIEAKTTHDQSVWGPCIKEWVGSNGTRDEEATDLWAQVEEWEKDPQGGQQIVKPAYSYQEYEAPDGARGSYSFFKKEINSGRLHGLLVCFN